MLVDCYGSLGICEEIRELRFGRTPIGTRITSLQHCVRKKEKRKKKKEQEQKGMQQGMWAKDCFLLVNG